jgi:hypothetical protein
MRKRERCRERGRVRNSYPGNLFNSSFYAPLKNTIVTGRGSSTPTFTRGRLTAWWFDNEGKLKFNFCSFWMPLRFSGGSAGLEIDLFPTTSESISVGGVPTGTSTPDAQRRCWRPPAQRRTSSQERHPGRQQSSWRGLCVGQARVGKGYAQPCPVVISFYCVWDFYLRKHQPGHWRIQRLTELRRYPVRSMYLTGVWDIQLYATRYGWQERRS